MKKVQREELAHCNIRPMSISIMLNNAKKYAEKKRAIYNNAKPTLELFLFLKNIPSRPIFKSPSSVFIVSIDVVAVVACWLSAFTFGESFV